MLNNLCGSEKSVYFAAYSKEIREDIEKQRLFNIYILYINIY